MTEAPETASNDLQRSQTNNDPQALFLATLSALEKETAQLEKEIALMGKESAPGSKPKQREQALPTLTTRECLTWAQEKTDTNHFPQLLPQKALSTEEIAAFLAEHKASVDKLSRHFSVYQRVLDKTRPQRRGFLWKGRLPLGGLTLLNGAHGTGKSLLVSQIAAAVSSGAPMPDGTPTVKGGVVIVAPYADAAPFLLPLLAALGADLSRIRIISYIQEPAPEFHTSGFRPFTLPEDFTSLSHAIEQVDARLVIMDPFMSLLSYEQRWTNERLRRLLTDLHQRMVERDVACILVRNCPARGSHTRPSQLERSDHFECIATSSLLLAPDPIHPDRLLLSHADSYAYPLAQTLTLQIQPLPNDPDFASLSVLGSHSLSADDFMEHRPDTLRRQLLSNDLLSFINASAAPIPVTKLYAHFSPASPFQIQRSLKDLLNTEQIERPSRGIYAPLPGDSHVGTGVSLANNGQPENEKPLSAPTHHALPLDMDSVPKIPIPESLHGTVPTTLDQPLKDELTEPAAITLELPPTNELTATTTLEPLPTNELTESAAITLKPPPKDELIEYAVTTSNHPLTNRNQEIAAVLSDPAFINRLKEYTATASDPFSREKLQKIVAVLSNPSLTNGPNEISTTLTGLPLTYAIVEITAKEPKSLLRKMVQEIVAFIGAPSPTNRLQEVAAIMLDTKVTNRTH